MLADESGRDLFGRISTIIETTHPVLLMFGLGFVALLVILGFMQKYRLLLLIVLTAAALTGARSDTLDSALTMIRWIIIVAMAIGVLFVRQHPGMPILMWLALVVLGLLFGVQSDRVSWSIQAGLLFLATTMLGITSAIVMSDRADLRRLFWLFLGPSLVWSGVALFYLPEFLAGRMEYGFGRFAGFANTSGMFSMSGALLMPCLLWQAMQPVRMGWRLLSMGAFVLTLVLVMLSTQRTALYAGIIACLPLAMSINFRAIAVVLAVAVGTWLMMSQLQLVMNKRQSEFLVERMTDTETSGRYQLWMDSLDELLRNPLIGHGFGSDRWLAQGGHLDHKQRPHNWYIVIWHNTGLFGLLLLIATLGVGTFSSLRILFTHADDELKGMSRLVTGQLLGLTATGLVDSMGSPSNIQTITLVLFLVAAGRLPIIYRQEQIAEAEAEEQESHAQLTYGDVYAHQL